MLVVYMDRCKAVGLAAHQDFEINLGYLERQSPVAWASAEDLPEEVFFMGAPGSYSGRVLSLIQRDEFCACYVDANEEWALTINH